MPNPWLAVYHHFESRRRSRSCLPEKLGSSWAELNHVAHLSRFRYLASSWYLSASRPRIGCKHFLRPNRRVGRPGTGCDCMRDVRSPIRSERKSQRKRVGTLHRAKKHRANLNSSVGLGTGYIGWRLWASFFTFRTLFFTRWHHLIHLLDFFLVFLNIFLSQYARGSYKRTALCSHVWMLFAWIALIFLKRLRISRLMSNAKIIKITYAYNLS